MICKYIFWDISNTVSDISVLWNLCMFSLQNSAYILSFENVRTHKSCIQF